MLKAKSLGLAAIAITDHDTIGSVHEALAAGERHGVEVVPGVEIGIAHDPDRHLIEIDILGYFVDPDFAELEGAAAAAPGREEREAREADRRACGERACYRRWGKCSRRRRATPCAARTSGRCVHRHHPDFDARGVLRPDIVRGRLARREGLQPEARGERRADRALRRRPGARASGSLQHGVRQGRCD